MFSQKDDRKFFVGPGDSRYVYIEIYFESTQSINVSHYKNWKSNKRTLEEMLTLTTRMSLRVTNVTGIEAIKEHHTNSGSLLFLIRERF